MHKPSNDSTMLSTYHQQSFRLCKHISMVSGGSSFSRVPSSGHHIQQTPHTPVSDLIGFFELLLHCWYHFSSSFSIRRSTNNVDTALRPNMTGFCLRAPHARPTSLESLESAFCSTQANEQSINANRLTGLNCLSLAGARRMQPDFCGRTTTGYLEITDDQDGTTVFQSEKEQRRHVGLSVSRVVASDEWGISPAALFPWNDGSRTTTTGDSAKPSSVFFTRYSTTKRKVGQQ